MLEQQYLWFWIILLCLSVLQWVLIIPAAFRKNVAFERFAKRKPKIEIHLFDDIYFLYWNISCPFYIAVYLFILYSAPNWIASFEFAHSLSPGTIIEKHNQNVFLFFERIYVVIFVATCLAGWAVWLQIKKISDKYCSETKCTYWWCSQSCKFCFNVRLVFVFINVLGFSLVTWKLSVISYSLITMLDGLGLKANLFNPDGMAGFKTLGKLVTLISLTFLLRSVLGIAGYIDHNRKRFGGRSYFFADTYHALYVFPALLVVVVPGLYLLEMVNHAKLVADVNVPNFQEFLNSESIGQKVAWYKNNEMRLSMLKQIDGTSPFFISLKNYGFTVLIYILPLMIFSFKHLLQKRYKKTNA